MRKQMLALASDEENWILWDMDALLQDIFETYTPQKIQVADITPREWLEINEEYAMETDLSKPIVLFQLPGSLLFTADGNHRLYKAVAMGVPTIEGVFIPLSAHKKFIKGYDEVRFTKVIHALKSEGIFVEWSV